MESFVRALDCFGNYWRKTAVILHCQLFCLFFYVYIFFAHLYLYVHISTNQSFYAVSTFSYSFDTYVKLCQLWKVLCAQVLWPSRLIDFVTHELLLLCNTDLFCLYHSQCANIQISNGSLLRCDHLHKIILPIHRYESCCQGIFHHCKPSPVSF